MNQKLTLPAAPDADEGLTPSDDAVRQALLRMGSASLPSRRGGEQASPAASGDSRRRRFSQNENVPVEYVSRDRHAGARHENRHELAEGPDPQIAQLKSAVERERQMRETAERSLQEIKGQLQVAQTRLAHLEIDLAEARANRIVVVPVPPQLETRPEPQPVSEEEALVVATIDEADEPIDFTLAAPAKPMRRTAVRGRGRPRLKPRIEVAPEDEPEPVKWWIKD